MVTTGTTTQLRNWLGDRPSWKQFTLCIAITFTFCNLSANSTAAAATQITQFGITWTFDKDYTTGTFANGDYYVIGNPNVTIIQIEPNSFCGDGARLHQDGWTPASGRYVNGSVVNPSTAINYETQGFDSSITGYTDLLNVSYPIRGDDANTLVLAPGSSLVSTVSRVKDNDHQTYLRTAAILTVLDSVPSAGSFRPPYCGSGKTIKFNKSQLNYSLLGSLNPVTGAPAMSTVEACFERPWLDYSNYFESSRWIHPKDSMPDYGREVSNQIGIGALMLHCNFTNAQKETLMIRYVQLGIDLYGAMLNGREWPPNGGHNSGRKWPILFAGIILNDANMKAIGEKSGDYLYSSGHGANNNFDDKNHPTDYIDFGEDGSTFYVEANDVWGPPFSLWGLNFASCSGVGTISAVNGSKVITGSGTNWVSGSYTVKFGVENDNQANSITGRAYTIASVDSPTKITLTTNYSGNTASGMSYMIAQRLYYGHGTYSKDNDANEYTTSDLGLPEWGLAHSNDRRQDDSWWLAEYRNTCTANSWAGFVLAAQIMQSGSSAKTLWNHNVLFDYMDSYMKTEADAGRTGTWNRQWDTWTEKMWDTYRANYGSIWAAPGSSNKPPNADAGPDQTSAASATSGTALVTLNGSHSSSSNGSIVSYVWAERGGQIAAVATPTVPLPIGQHTITLQVTDNSGLTDTDTVVITVEEMTADITPPSIISVTASESSVEIQFSESLDGASAGSAGNYGLSDSVKINYVRLDTGYNRVILYTDMQTDGKTYTLNVVNVKDAAGNPMAQTSVTYICDSGLAGYYLFGDAGNSYVLDSSGHNNTGYYINGVHRTDQQEATLGGGDDAVQISTTDWNAARGTVALWINGTSMLGTRYIFGHSDESEANLIQLYTDNGYLCVGMGDNHLLKTSIQLLSPQTWYHIALSWDGANYAVYVNGSLSANGTYAGLTLLSNLADIGNTGDATSRTEGFQGLIDEVRIYNRTLTAAEISNLALAFLPIGDKTVAAGNQLSFTIRTRPDVTMTLAESNLPSLPSLVSNTFNWTPGYTNAGTYEVEFTAPHGTSMDFEKVAIKVTDANLPEINSPPIGYWKFDETSGDIASDSSASGDTGYLENGLTWETGKINGAIVFSVPNDAVEIQTTNFNLQQGTIAMWVYVQRQTLSRHYFFGHVTDTTNRIQLYDKYGYLCLGLGDSHETSVNIQRLQNQRWYHIVLTWNKPAYNVYVNGVLKASGTYSGLTAFADHADIGNNGFGRNMGLNGKIDDVQIYNRVLNADEIIRLDVGY